MLLWKSRMVGGVHTGRVSDRILTSTRYSAARETNQMPIGIPMYMSASAPAHMQIVRPTSIPVSTPTQSPRGTLTPDFSAPQVVPGQFNYPIPQASLGGTSVGSPHVRAYGFKEHVDSYDGPEAAPPPIIPTAPKEKRTCGMRKRYCSILFGCIIIAILALALGLGLGLGLRRNES